MNDHGGNADGSGFGRRHEIDAFNCIGKVIAENIVSRPQLKATKSTRNINSSPVMIKVK